MAPNPVPEPTPFSPPNPKTSKNLGPITTLLTFPEDCTTNQYDLQTSALMDDPQFSYFTQGVAVESCRPKGLHYTKAFQWLEEYYSPAICPQSWKVCGGPRGGIIGGDTVAFCCPGDFTCPQKSSWFACVRHVATPTVAYVMDPSGVETVATTTITTSGYLNVAYPIQVRWRMADMALMPKETKFFADPPAGDAGAPLKSGGLSLSAQIAIGVCAGAIGLGLLAVLGWWLWRRKQVRQSMMGSFGGGNAVVWKDGKLGAVNNGPPRRLPSTAGGSASSFAK